MEAKRPDFMYIPNFCNFYYNYSFIKDEDWSYILKTYNQDIIHLNISKVVYGTIIKFYNTLKLKRSSVIFNAMIFFHKYYIYNLYSKQVDLDNTKLAYLAVACLYVGTKSSDLKIRIKDILEYSYKANILPKELGDKNREIILNYEFEILRIIQFDISNYGLTYKSSYYIFESIFNSLKLEYKDPSVSENIKDYFLAQLRYSFIFPFFLKYDKKTIILSCVNLIFKQLFPNSIIPFWENKEFSDIKLDIIDCSKLFSQLLIPKKENSVYENNINNINNEEEKGININIVRNINSTITNNI